MVLATVREKERAQRCSAGFLVAVDAWIMLGGLRLDRISSATTRRHRTGWELGRLPVVEAGL